MFYGLFSRNASKNKKENYNAALAHVTEELQKNCIASFLPIAKTRTARQHKLYNLYRVHTKVGYLASEETRFPYLTGEGFKKLF